jgi:hypothetical protein
MEHQDAFVRSWDLVERCYESLDAYPPGQGVVELVREMRRRGYDRLFRAGMAATCLVLSRSAEHGLRREQPFVQLFVRPFARDERMYVWCGPGKGGRFVEESFAFTPALERALAELAQAPVD